MYKKNFDIQCALLISDPFQVSDFDLFGYMIFLKKTYLVKNVLQPDVILQSQTSRVTTDFNRTKYSLKYVTNKVDSFLSFSFLNKLKR